MSRRAKIKHGRGWAECEMDADDFEMKYGVGVLAKATRSWSVVVAEQVQLRRDSCLRCN